MRKSEYIAFLDQFEGDPEIEIVEDKVFSLRVHGAIKPELAATVLDARPIPPKPLSEALTITVVRASKDPVAPYDGEIK